MKNKIIAIVCLVFFLGLSFSSCVTSTNVRFESDVEGATVLVDGEDIGTTPVQHKLSNAIWEDPDVVLKKDGYKDQTFSVKKEVKMVNLVCGLILWWPSLLWVYGPKKVQSFSLAD